MNWWELELETEAEKRLQAEVERLRGLLSEAVTAIQGTVRVLDHISASISEPGLLAYISLLKEMELEPMINKVEQPAQPTGLKLPGLE